MARPTGLHAGDPLRDEALADRRGCLLHRRPGFVQRGLINVELGARIVQRRVDRSTDLVSLRDDARAVATTTTVIKASSPRTTTPAASVGLSPRRSSFRARGLKTTARTAAKSSGSTISLTAPNAAAMMIVASTNPTKLHAQTPIFGT